MPAPLSRSQRSVIFIIVTSAGLPDKPVESGTVCLVVVPARLRSPLAVTSKCVLAELVDAIEENPLAPQYCSFLNGNSVWSFRERQLPAYCTVTTGCEPVTSRSEMGAHRNVNSEEARACLSDLKRRIRLPFSCGLM
jgi:hypothetical protein